MATVPEVWISILNWNCGEDILACVKSLQALDYPNFKIVVSDNGSTDGSDESLRRLYPELEIRHNGVNLGFSGGHNRVLRAAIDCTLSTRPHYVWLLNSDTLVAPDSLRLLVETAESRPRPGLYSPVLMNREARDRVQFRRGWFDAEAPAFRATAKPDVLPPPGNIAPTLLWGTALLANIEACAEVGLLEEDYFAYVEDYDWCLRMARHQRNVDIVETSIVWHALPPSTLDKSALFHFLMARNAVLFWRRNASGARLRRVLRRHASEVIGTAGNHRDRRNREKMAACLNGLRDGLLGRVGPPPRDFSASATWHVLGSFAAHHLAGWIAPTSK